MKEVLVMTKLFIATKEDLVATKVEGRIKEVTGTS